MEGVPVAVAEHEIAVVVLRTSGELLCSLSNAMSAECGHRGGINCNGATGAHGLRRRVPRLVRHTDEASTNVQPAGTEVDVAPPQTQDLATPRTRRGEHDERGVQPMLLRCTQE